MNTTKRIYRLLDQALTDLHIAHTLVPAGTPAHALIRVAEQAVADADKAMRRRTSLVKR